MPSTVPPPMTRGAALETKRFLIVTGKGGVGKTTVCAAEALALAAKGKRVLVCMCNAKERLSAMLGSELIGPEVKSVATNVWAVNMEPERALAEYGMMALHSKTLFKLLFDNKYVRKFFRAVPGMQEWTLLGKAWWHTTEQDETRPRWDVVILDAPATGHGLDMLRVPRVLTEVAPPGLLRREAENALRLFQDPKRSGVVIVTLPEDMPTNETIDLHAALIGELRLPVVRLVANGVFPPLFGAGERDTFESLAAALPSSSPLSSIAHAARARALREGVQAVSLARLAKEIPVPRTELPYLFVAEFRRACVEALAAAF